jgi:hypothetical protein
MKKITFVVFLVLIVGFATTFAGTQHQKSRISNFIISLDIMNNPPKVGKNPVAVEVKDVSGNSVTDAKVYIEYDMGKMSHSKKAVFQEGMCYATELTCTGEKYHGELDFDKAGDWFINVKTVRSGKAYTGTFKTKVVK